MKIQSILLGTDEGSRCTLDEGERIDSPGDFLDLMARCRSETIVLGREDFDPAFFDLKSGLAGEILQKVSNYRKRLVVLGDFDSLGGKALGDFIYESNRTGHVVFAPDLPAAARLLR
jgi:Domain of unknown function (DUF4180)